MTGKNSLNISAATKNVLARGKHFLNNHPTAKKIYNHKFLVSGLVVSILAAPKVNTGIEAYLQNKHTQELAQIQKDSIRKELLMKKARAIAEKEKQIKEFNRSIAILSESVSYARRALTKKGITPTESLYIREKILNESKKLLPIIREQRKEALKELEKLENS